MVPYPGNVVILDLPQGLYPLSLQVNVAELGSLCRHPRQLISVGPPGTELHPHPR